MPTAANGCRSSPPTHGGGYDARPLLAKHFAASRASSLNSPMHLRVSKLIPLLFASLCALCGHPISAADWAAHALADAKHDRTSIPYDGKTPDKMVCDTTLRELPDGFVSKDRQWLHFASDDHRHRAVHYSAKLPALP